mmetsp:Transcript_114913/g.245337  ORF Transcript_114913/g.245337 Transcript_114913/m.245337 type:complete len:338 (-) Transcript_114913:100-1113(-)
MAAAQLLSMSVADVVGILQQVQSTRQSERWARRGYNMGLQKKRVDMIDTVREEMRDQVKLIISSIEGLMLVAALLCSLGYGFVVEGTFPDTDAGGTVYDDVGDDMLTVYSVLAAFTQIFPLATLLVATAIRVEAELCQHLIMGDLTEHISRALEKATRNVQSPDAAAGTMWRRQFSPSGVDWGLGDDDYVVNRYRDDSVLVKHLAQSLLQKVHWYHLLYPVAQMLLWIGMLSAVLLSGVMFGLIHRVHLPDMPWVWRCYTAIVSLGAVGCVCFLTWIRRRVPERTRRAANRAGAAARAQEAALRVVVGTPPISPSGPQLPAIFRRRGHGLEEPLLPD